MALQLRGVSSSLANYDALSHAAETAQQTVSPFTIADFMRRINLVLREPEYRNQFFSHISEEDFARLLTSRPISNEWLEVLQSRKLLPTPAILAFALEQGKKAESGLEAIATDINDGNFDKTDQLHIEIEYSRYVLKGPPTGNFAPDRNLSLQNFAQLPTEGSRIRLAGADLEHVLNMAQETADEAVEVLNFIVAQPNSRAPKLVIANQRYGDLFVIQPISEYLVRSGGHIINQRVSSMGFDVSAKITRSAGLSHETIDWITTHKPDVFVVDGTVGFERNGVARFPAAMLGYLNEFKAYNAACGIETSADPAEVKRLARFNPQHGYRFGFWTPDGEQQRFFVGNFELKAEDYSFATNKETRQLTIVSSTRSRGSYAFFDDPEHLASRKVLCFTKKGLGICPLSDGEDTLVGFVQQYMKGRIAEKLG